MMDLKTLTPQELFLYNYHMKNLVNGNEMFHKNGDKSSMLQMVAPYNGKYINIPTLWDGKQLPPEQAYRRAGQVGFDKWPAYNTPEEADARYLGDMHGPMEQDMGRFTPAPLQAPAVPSKLGIGGKLQK